jgi:hypothetical protein
MKLKAMIGTGQNVVFNIASVDRDTQMAAGIVITHHLGANASQ